MFLPNVTNILTSAIIIRLLAPEWWGQITILQLYMYLGTQFCAWGNRDTLVKSFSENPSISKFLWMESFSNRLFLLLPVLVGTYFIASDFISNLYLSSWIIIRYFMQSFEAIILFSRKFLVSILAEITGLIVTISLIVIFKNIVTFHDVLLIITIGYFIKTAILIIKFRTYFNFSLSIKPNVKRLMSFLPFMMIGFLGVLQQKSDMISIAWLSSKIEVAQYQVFSSFLLFMQSIPGLIIGPYIKNLYRLPPSSYSKLQRFFSVIGLIISLVGSIIIYLAIKIIYHFDFPFTMYLLGFSHGFFTYFYMLKIYLMFKNQKQQQVMIISAATILLNFILCFIFIQIWNLQGAILANVMTQLSIYLIYKFYLKNKLAIKL
jgi:O-antigen/teichoic acid export membrane protein